MEPTQASTGRSASDWALHQLLDLIRVGTFGAGDRLPPERTLAVRLGVSRGSVREAISALVTLGVLESRHGAGVFVTSLEPTTILSGLTHVVGIMAAGHPEAVTRLHAQVEGGAAARAAARATPETLASLSQALAELRIARHEPEPRGHRDTFRQTIWRLSDDRFHRAVARIAEDPVAEGMIMLLRGSRGHQEPEGDAGLTLHTALVAAIAGHEPDTARAIAENLIRAEHPLRHPEVATAQPPAAAGHGTRDADDGASGEWFRDAKFGLIVHWGIYSVPGWAPVPPDRDDAAGPIVGTEDGPVRYFTEWYQAAALQDTPTADYHQRVHGGRPYREFRAPFEAAVRGWSPEPWADAFASSGARYIVQVAKHHDGYLLWPSRVRHPRDEEWRCSRDVIGETATAVRERGLRFGIYYSAGADWSFGDHPVADGSDVQTSRPEGADYARYVEAHWRELIETYRPDGLWNDTGYPAAADAQRLIRDYHALIPDGAVSERFRTSAPSLTPAPAEGGPWESLRPIGLSFGWNRQESEEDALSGPELVLLLMDVVARNGNLLLGVSPDERGDLPRHQLAALDYLGRWLARFGEAVYGTRPWSRATGRTTEGRTVWFTGTADALCLTIEATRGGEVEVEDLRVPAGARLELLAGGEPVKHWAGGRGSVLDLPAPPADSPVIVLRLSPVPGDVSSVG